MSELIPDGTPYMPSNGSEGDAFMARWCENCANDKDDTCDILTLAMCESTVEQWIYKDGKPCCTAYRSEEKPPIIIDPNQLSLDL